MTKSSSTTPPMRRTIRRCIDFMDRIMKVIAGKLWGSPFLSQLKHEVGLGHVGPKWTDRDFDDLGILI